MAGASFLFARFESAICAPGSISAHAPMTACFGPKSVGYLLLEAGGALPVRGIAYRATF
jgi:hypothetical protein